MSSLVHALLKRVPARYFCLFSLYIGSLLLIDTRNIYPKLYTTYQQSDNQTHSCNKCSDCTRKWNASRGPSRHEHYWFRYQRGIETLTRSHVQYERITDSVASWTQLIVDCTHGQPNHVHKTVRPLCRGNAPRGIELRWRHLTHTMPDMKFI